MTQPGKRGMTGKHGNHWRPPVKVRVVLTCEVCGKAREYLPSQARRRTGRFCSQACAGQARDTRPVKSCPVCGTQTRNKVYCSAKCQPLGRQRVGAKWRDPEQIRAYMAAYVQRNKARHNERSREWAKRNRDTRNSLQRQRRLTEGPQGLSAAEWVEIRQRYGFRCLACGCAESLLERLEADHVIPVVMGGMGSADNIQPLCRSCNARKSGRHIDYRITILET